jgi:hypothetical protein
MKSFAVMPLLLLCFVFALCERKNETHLKQKAQCCRRLRAHSGPGDQGPVRSPQAIPIPGFKTLQQVEANANTLQLGALADDQIREITALLAREDQL